VQHADRTVADLPAVAVRARRDPAAPQCRQPFDRGQLVAQAGRDEQLPCLQLLAAGGRDDEPVRIAARADGMPLPDLDAVAGELRAAVRQQAQRRGAIAAEQAVHVGGEAVARLAAVEHDDPPPHPRQVERGAQPGAPSSDNDEIAYRLVHIRDVAARPPI
jgi:hypothetical protein